MKRLIIILLIISGTSFAQSIKPGMTSEQIKKEQSKIMSRLGKYPAMFLPWKSQSERKVQLQRVTISPSQNRIHIYCNEPLGQIAIREKLVTQWEQMVRDTLGKGYEECRVQIYSKNIPIERFVPNYYRSKIAIDQSRQGTNPSTIPLTQNMDRPIFGKGLSYKQIAVWASHGKYYDAQKGGWIYQRPPLFGSVEDLNTFEYVHRYLIPMLENAGAVVITPRERDPNPRELIIEAKEAKVLSGTWKMAEGGFQTMKTITDENPFEKGQHLSTINGGSVEYPIATEISNCALYVSYRRAPGASNKVIYKVTHRGAETTYRVNQQKGSGWVYLGSHSFDKSSKVEVTTDGVATTDAIRLGGGMGNILRAGALSGVPRWAEGARYSMQYSGVPASIYAQDSEKEPKDYNDDYKARGDWATWIQNDMGVGLDAVLALHTNAGVSDTTFGTLVINHTNNKTAKYTNGQSKWAAHDLADIVVTQIVEDIRAKFNPTWTHRSIYDKQYAEVSRPDAPAIIIELLSHQNLGDMVLALDPAFRFTACRAIYKGLLRFLSSRYGTPYVVQPLAPESFTMRLSGDKLQLMWKATTDPLEATAQPTYYMVYERIGSGGFDNGTIVRRDQYEFPINKDGKVRSYKITALNDGGESFPCETLSACFLPNGKKTAIVVNEFTKLSPPDTIRGGLDFKNFMPYQHDYGIIGRQVSFERSSQFVDNENPGWGKSTMELATVGISGNTFDYTMQKGAALTAEGYSYISSSAAGYDRSRSYDKVVTITQPIP